jgi:hypothetical protein
MKQAKLLRSVVGALAILSMTLSVHAAEGPLTLVKDGKPTSVIVVPAAPNQSALWGAKELQWHFKKMTGAEVPVVTDREKVGADQVQILVGESRATRALGLSAKGYGCQEYSLETKGNAIVLLGADVNVDYPTLVSGTPTGYAKGRFGSAMTGWGSVGVKDHGFNDEQGTLECFVYVAAATNESTTGWMILRVGDEQNGHLIQTRSDKATKKLCLVYQTFVNGQAKEIEVKGAWQARSPGWHHLMVTWDAKTSKAEVFLDGKSAGSAAYTKTACNQAPFFSIRGDGKNIPNCFGPIDEVRLSRVVRKPVVPEKAYETDDDTLALLHFDDVANLARDDSDAARGDVAATLTRWNQTDPSGYEQMTGCKPPDTMSDRNGSLYAVYDFLEKSCGVRWYAPTEEGMVCPQTNTLTVTVKTLRRKPAFDFRSATGGPYTWGMVSTVEPHPNDRRILDSRMKMGGKNWLVTHSFEGWPDRFWEKNPANPDAWETERKEYFFLNPDGSRNKEQICFSSTGALAQVILDTRRYFDTGNVTFRAVAHDDFYVVAPRDTALYTCQCPDCKKGYELAGTNWPNTFNNGKASEIFYAFLNKVQAAIDKSHPGKHIASFNYMDYIYYPKSFELNTNLYVGFAQCWSSVLPNERKEMLDCYEPWRKKIPGRNQVCVWRYDGWWWGQADQSGVKLFPMWYPHALAEEIQMYARDNARGLFYCGINNYFDGWLSLKLLDDPDLDVDHELDYFFTHYYGGAAAPMRAIYDTIHTTHTNLANYPPGVAEGGPGSAGGADLQWYWLGRPPVMAKLGKLMDEAKQKADTELSKKRVAAYERDIWVNHMLAAYNKYVSEQPGKKHPYPFLPPAPVVVEREASGVPSFLTRVFFRNGGPGVGVWETGFDDRQGTMEGWVQVGGLNTNGYWHGHGLLLEIESLKPATGHRVYLKPDITKKVLIPIYETWSAGKTNAVKGAPIPAPAGNKWYHIAASWGIKASGDASMALFVNGKPSGTPAPYGQTLCSDRVFTAGWPTKTMSGFGAIDEIRLSNIVRTPAVQKEPYETDKNTLLLLHFDEEPGLPATDASKAVKQGEGE